MVLPTPTPTPRRPLTPGTPLRTSTNTHQASTSNHSNSEGSTDATILQLQRQVAGLQQKNDVLAGKKRKRGQTTTQMGRGIRKLVHLLDPVSTIILEGEAYEMMLREKEEARAEREANGEDPEDDEEDELLLDDPTPEQEALLAEKRDAERNYTAYLQLHRLVPNLANKLLTSDPEELTEFYNALQSGANDARSDDINRLADRVGEWLNQSYAKHGRPPTPLFQQGCRKNRGLPHDIAGFYLCSLDDDWDDMEIRTKIRNCEIQIGSSFYIRAFYPKGQGNIYRVEQGFLRSELLLIAFKVLFTSPSSVGHDIDILEDLAPPTKKPNPTSTKVTRGPPAQILNMNNKVTPRSIAYVAVLLHFVLTNAGQWRVSYYGLEYRALYNFIVDFFEDVRTPAAKKRVDELLAFWNRNIFPNSPVSIAQAPGVVSSRRLLAEQRAAEEEEAEEEERVAAEQRVAAGAAAAASA